MPEDELLAAFEMVTKEFIDRLGTEFKRRLEKKTGWGKDEVYQEFLQSLAIAAIGTSSLLISPVEEVFVNERMED